MSNDRLHEERRNAEMLNRKRAERAEHVSNWYFRLNGFLSIPGFVVHPNTPQRYPLTEADLIAVRFPNSSEVIGERPMVDDRLLTSLANGQQKLFILVEVKLDLCRINGPWSDPAAGNMQRVINRLGFAKVELVDQVAQQMYAGLRWEDEESVLQYVSVGQRVNDGLQRTHSKLRQITWDQISEFLFARFKQFPEKLPDDGRSVHRQWPDFGRRFGTQVRRMSSVQDAREFVRQYIEGDAN
jgi:hypothetical protein